MLESQRTPRLRTPSPRGTRKPNPSRGCGRAEGSKPRQTTATEAYSIASSMAASVGSSEDTIRADTGEGEESTTASAGSRSPPASVQIQRPSSGRRATETTSTPVRTEEPSAPALPSTRSWIPPQNEVSFPRGIPMPPPLFAGADASEAALAPPDPDGLVAGATAEGLVAGTGGIEERPSPRRFANIPAIIAFTRP